MAKPTEEELLLLNSLMYTDDFVDYATKNPGATILDWANQYDPSKNVGGAMNSNEIQQLANTVSKNPDTYEKMTIKDFDNSQEANTDGSQRVKNAAIDYGGDMIVVYCGTAGDTEWDDNGLGGHSNITDTEQQMRALEYYDRVIGEHHNGKGKIYVTGHSKGGNKAQYVTVLRDGVASCTSFDGQGFGYAFLKKYEKEIAAAKEKITTVANEYDFVNILFNSIAGETKYIKSGDDIDDYLNNGLSSFARWHSPYTMFSEQDGVVVLGEATEHSDLMRELEGILDYCVEHMSEEDLRYLIHMVMNAFIEDGELKNDDYPMPDGFTDRMIIHATSYLKKQKGVTAFEAFASISRLLRIFKIPTTANLLTSGAFAIYYATIPETGYSDHLRDFTEATKQMLLGIVEEVEDEPWWNVTKWDVWYRVEDFFVGVDFPANSEDLHSYYKKMIDINGATAEKLEQIFQDVYNLESAYNQKITDYKSRADGILTSLQNISDAIVVSA